MAAVDIGTNLQVVGCFGIEVYTTIQPVKFLADDGPFLIKIASGNIVGGFVCTTGYG
ncbi:hypothetical protein D3C78_1968800 [compost metagenome]